MIEGFEKQTHELDEYERVTLLPSFVTGLSRRIGEERAITSTEIMKRIKKSGHDINGARVRKLIHFIRVNGLVKQLIATSKGYYVENNPEKFETYLNSLKQRENSIREVRLALSEQKVVNYNDGNL